MLEELKNEMLKNLREYITDEKTLCLINKALNFAEEKGADLKHYDGTLFLLHVYRTNLLLTKLHSDALTIASSLVWWIPVFGSNIKMEDIKDEFGEEIYNISLSLSKITSLKLKDDLEYSKIYLRKVLVGLSTDVRVIIIKLCSRLDNLKYVYTIPDERQKQKCIETESVYIPIAHRLGINYIKSELEDICLKYLKLDAYQEILEKLELSYDELNKYIDIMKNELSLMMEKENISFRIKGRVKSVHSLYEKMAKGKRFKDIYDVLALRIIVKEVSECYLAIGLIHSKYRPIPKRFKDYIAQPKENMYQSIHTGVIGPDGKIFEIQIRTEEMDEIAECGIASHWSYKEHGTKSIQKLMEQKLELFRDAMEVTKEESEVENEFKEVFVEKMVYVFTPNGDVIELPVGSTPVDLAYKIHSHIGDTMVGAIVNDEIVPINYELQNDDIVKINTNESSSPNREWLKFVKTNQAKNRIKTYYSKQEKEECLRKGEELLNKELKRRKLSFTETLSSTKIAKVLKELSLKDLDDIKMSIGSLKYTAKYIINLLTEEKPDVKNALLEKISSTCEKKDDENYKSDIIVEGCDNVLITIANCCKPVYGDDIIGYITKGNGISVHKANCINLKNMDARIIDVSWSNKPSKDYLTRLIIKAKNVGSKVLDIFTIASQRNLIIESMNTHEKDEFILYEMMVKVPNASVLKQFMTDVMALNFVVNVEREVK